MEQYVYIKKSIFPHFVDFAEALKAEEYNNLGETYQDYLDNKWVLLNDDQVAYLEAHENADVKEVWDMAPAQKTLEQAKMEKMMQINAYDRSNNVNSFTINGTIEGWFTPEQRSNYKSSIDAAKLLGVESLQFFIGDLLLNITPTQAELMLAQIQLYADQCYIVTKEHQIAVEQLETVEAVENYDHTAGYPTRLNFPYEIPE